jgi:hypothetical protein
VKHSDVSDGHCADVLLQTNEWGSEQLALLPNWSQPWRLTSQAVHVTQLAQAVSKA